MKKRFFVGLLTVLCVAGVAVGAMQMPHVHRIPHEEQMRAARTVWDDDMMTATVLGADDAQYDCVGEDAMYLTTLVADMIFRPEQVCKCEAEMQIQTSMGTVEISLSDAFVRCEQGQASLTQAQLQKLSGMKAVRMVQKWNEIRQ